MSEIQTEAEFRQHLNTPFRVQVNAPKPIDLTLVAVSRAPLVDIERFRQRMGWRFNWVSSHGSDFNYDFGVSFTPEELAKGDLYYNYGTTPYAHEEAPGLSVFYKDDAGEVFHTYSTYARGAELLLGVY